MDIVYLDGEERASFPYGLTRSIIQQLEAWAARLLNVRVMTIRDGKEIMTAYSKNGQLHWTEQH